jgi:hypothetical protein
LLTVVTKSNAQRHAMVMWDEIAAEVSAEFPDVTWDKMLVDAMTMRMVMKPQTLDTIVATNLHADILSDLAAALAGSLGIAPTANINPRWDAPSMFARKRVISAKASFVSGASGTSYWPWEMHSNTSSTASTPAWRSLRWVRTVLLRNRSRVPLVRIVGGKPWKSP